MSEDSASLVGATGGTGVEHVRQLHGASCRQSAEDWILEQQQWHHCHVGDTAPVLSATKVKK